MERAMAVTTLVAWALTAVVGLFILGTWLAGGGVRRAGDRGRHRRLPPSLVFGHLTLAAAGLAVWAVFVTLRDAGVAWLALGFLVVAAVLGIAMFVRWVPSYRARSTGRGPGAAHRVEPERNIPLTIVLGHGVLAVTTLVLVVLTALAG